MEWKKIFEDVPDYRKNHPFKKHILGEILMLSLCASLSGAENDEEIETYGKEKKAFLSGFLSLPCGIPSHDTITRVFRYLDKDKFSECLYSYTKELLEFIDHQHISIDGKVCRGTNKGGKKKSGICIITAWACEQGLSLGQLKTEEKSTEKTAIPALLEEIELKNTIVSIDAIGNSPVIAQKIVSKGGDYLLSLKKNQRTTYEQVSDYMRANRAFFEMDKNSDRRCGRFR